MTQASHQTERCDCGRAIEIDRSAKLIAFIKTETRWRILAQPATLGEFAIEDYTTIRGAFVRHYARARQRAAPLTAAQFYDAVANRAAAFAFLIAARRRRQTDARQ